MHDQEPEVQWAVGENHVAFKYVVVVVLTVVVAITVVFGDIYNGCFDRMILKWFLLLITIF